MTTDMATLKSLCIVVLLFAGNAGFGDEPPGLLPPDANWIMHYDSKLDGKLDGHGEVRWKIAVRNNRMSGRLADAKEHEPSGHHLAGEIAAGRPPIVFLRQDGPKGLVCYYSGRRSAENQIAGTWFDNRGNSGDFELTIETK
jgi:hypothetical protein